MNTTKKLTFKQRLQLCADLSNKAVGLRVDFLHNDRANDTTKYKMICAYYVIAEEYHNTKFWFMKELPIVTK